MNELLIYERQPQHAQFIHRSIFQDFQGYRLREVRSLQQLRDALDDHQNDGGEICGLCIEARASEVANLAELTHDATRRNRSMAVVAMPYQNLRSREKTSIRETCTTAHRLWLQEAGVSLFFQSVRDCPTVAKLLLRALTRARTQPDQLTAKQSVWTRLPWSRFA